MTRGDRLWRVALSGNCAALVALLAAVSAWPTLFGPRGPSSSSSLYFVEPGLPAPERVLLVVFDALAYDVARDAGAMPNLARLARLGAWGDGRVESIVPSTVAGIQVLATGRVPPPLSILEDFGARRSRDGGVFSSLHAAGKRSFVAGPYLWFDLYGEWIHDGYEVETVHHDDPRALRAALSALDDDRYSFVVVHLSLCDDLAHLRGADSREYRDGAGVCDRALAELVERAGPETAIVATTDHGVTEKGGHASADPSAVRIPVVTSGPGLRRGELGSFAQGSIHDGLRALLSLPRRGSTDDAFVAATTRLGFWSLPVALGALCAVTTLAAASAGWRSRGRATAMDVAFWCGVALTFLQLPVAAVLTLLVGSASAVPPSVVLRRFLAPATLMATGAVFGLLRGAAARWLERGEAAELTACVIQAGIAVLLILAVGSPRRRSNVGGRGLSTLTLLGCAATAGFLLGGAWLATISLVAAGAGAWVTQHAREERSFVVGVVVASLPPLLVGVAGESLSLSELDLRLAFGRMDGAFGIVGAASVVFMRHAFPAVPLLVALLPLWRRGRRRQLSRLLAGAAAFFAGEALLFGGTLAIAESVWSASLALAGVLRVLFELCVVFLGVAVMLIFSRMTGTDSFPSVAIVARRACSRRGAHLTARRGPVR